MVRTQGRTNRGHASIGADTDSIQALSGACQRRKPSKIKDSEVDILGLSEVKRMVGVEELGAFTQIGAKSVKISF
jgi:hypothetical protein